MFDNDVRDKIKALDFMEKLSRERACFNEVAARDKFREFVRQDRRFDEFDADALVRRVQECRRSCAVLDLEDPRLRGLEKRPLERSNW
jgi:hypothetical protein